MAAPTKAFKPVQIKPLTGLLDLRSLPEEVAYGGYRWVENATALAVGKVCRRPGFQRLLAESTELNNQDLHNQGGYTRQPINGLFEAVSTSGARKLIATTQNRIYASNDSTGSWDVLTASQGGESSTACGFGQFSVAQVDDTVVFSNGYNPPSYYLFDQPPVSGTSVLTIPDLVDLNITKANVVVSWKNLMFVCNVVADGQRVNNRIVWSDFRRPLSFVPGVGSLAGFHDLGAGESILAAMPMGNSLLFYTTKGIWQCDVGDPTAEVLVFQQRYGEPSGQGCLAYRNTLVNIGDEHMYFGRDGIYLYNLYTTRPIRVDWIYKATAGIFDEINAAACDAQVGGYNAARKEVWFSWSKGTETCPYRTIVLSIEYTFADVIQRGFSAFCTYRPSNSENIRDFVLDQCICTNTELNASTDANWHSISTCFTPGVPVCPDGDANSIYSTSSLTVAGIDIDLENYTASSDADSICGRLGSVLLDDFCASITSADECNAGQRFVMASTTDGCLKQYGGIYAHEICTSTTDCGTYALQGYDFILRSGPVDFNQPSTNKFLKRFDVELTAEAQTIPSRLTGRIGFSHAASDSNSQVCPIMWHTLPPKTLACASRLPAASYADSKLQPYLAFEWPMYLGGRYLYWELKISGTGGASCFSSVSMDISVKPKGL